jgi:hypothetical protein
LEGTQLGMTEVSFQASGQPEREMINQLEKTVSPLTENLETEPMDRTFQSQECEWLWNFV